MDAVEKLQVLMKDAAFECEGGKSASARAVQQLKEQRLRESIYHAKVPGGTIPLLKTLLTNACIKNCAYCPIAAYCDHLRRLLQARRDGTAFYGDAQGWVS
jgi:predicted DNA-binding helix-hairpin-helix protein